MLAVLAFIMPALGLKEPACQCRRHKRCGFIPWVEKIPWRRAWQSIPIFLPGESPWTEEPGQGVGWVATIHTATQSQTQLKALSMCACMPSPIMNTMLTIYEFNILEYFLQLYYI